MQKLKKYSKLITTGMLVIFPPIFFLSYYPLISLGSTESMNLELSLPEIWLVLFFLFSLPQIPDLFRFYKLKNLCIIALIPLYFALSAIWSDNRLRTILTSGLAFLVIFAMLSLIYRLKNDVRNRLRHHLIKSLLYASAIVSAFCWVQCIADVAGFDRHITLLCSGCTASMFGFPHPSGFAIEPQFMGNLLLAPTLLCFYLVSTSVFTTRKKKVLLFSLTLFLAMTLFLTLSRGAIYAFVVALLALQIWIHKKSAIFKSLGICILAGIFSLAGFGFLSVLGPTSDGFRAGATKALHQLSLGIIDLRPKTAEPISNTTPVSSVVDVEEEIPYQPPAPIFDGYVPESTNTRLNLNSLAIKTWASSPQYITIGAGLGSAGLAMHSYDPEEIGPKEIVQNQYVSLLLEVGLVGCATVLGVVIFTTFTLIRHRLLVKNPLLICTVLGFLLTLCFFSGLPNAFHIYLFPLLFLNFSHVSKNYLLIKDIV